jgi:hypothetical protein
LLDGSGIRTRNPDFVIKFLRFQIEYGELRPTVSEIKTHDVNEFKESK